MTERFCIKLVFFVIVSEMIFKMKNIFCNLIKRHEPRLIKLVS